ncbi:hypothetical protein HWHPT5561_00535 [Petrotoga sp. HWH.PT.55.6.1]|uniref:hypothetical protein n=1 Tax=unclassified Petrotoga TaxID=2620614 RepID=UPI000CA066DE|nr:MULTISPECIES: hypothetical protein [unclassified Petrotoga]PNR93345.1 hypothetical protein X926_03795 [Petrotoga sp. HWHPT.55.6.3]RPD36596.1 hypothetical protein HWHPT5561_00535 [Petrotoga sp. HWH.PT.55.6.1]
MKRYLFIILLLIITLVYIKNYEIESPNLKFSLYTISEVESNFSSEPLQKELENILSSDLLLENMIIKRNNDSFLELGDNFDILVSFSYPNFEYSPSDVINNKKLHIKSSNIFKPLKIDLLDLWSQKDNLPKYQKEGVEFSGFFIDSEGRNTGFVYFFDELIKLSAGDTLGEDLVLAIFNDGILILTQDKRLCVL